jgi:putative CocE/NonD family hydrolase
VNPTGRALAATLGLPPPRAKATAVRNIPIRMSDGVILRADHYSPGRDSDAPTILIRTPYGRGGPMVFLSRALCEQGFHVLIQSCRGTFDSGGGPFEPLAHERDDGLDTIDWLRHQPWYGGSFGTYGPSYVGFTQWAVAAEAGPDLKALATMVTASSFRGSTYAGGGFSLDGVLTWSAILASQRAPLHGTVLDLLRGQPGLRRARLHAHPAEADVVAIGAEVPFFRAWLRGDSDEYWSSRGHTHRVGEVTAPVLMVGGFYDIFLLWQLDDYALLRAAGRQPRLVLGWWHHGSGGLFRASVREGVRFLQEHLLGEADLAPPTPVRVEVGPGGDWRDLPEWPPAHAPTPFHLDGDGSLRIMGDTEHGKPRAFRYDPRNPTPALGGPRLAGKEAGARDNRPLEARGDVLVWTGAPLSDPLEIIGPVVATIRATASSPFHDVFVRLCDVDPQGRSVNVCDGLTRVTGADPREPRDVEVRMWPTAYRLAPGHRLRVQVSGGAHPRWASNPGTGAALDEKGPTVPCDIAVHPGSRVLLPRAGRTPDRDAARSQTPLTASGD